MRKDIFAVFGGITAALWLTVLVMLVTGCAGPPKSYEDAESANVYPQVGHYAASEQMRNVNDHFLNEPKGEPAKPDKVRPPLTPQIPDDVPYEIKDEEEPEPIFAEGVVEETLYEPEPSYSDGTGDGYAAEYDEMYNTDGPTRQMPGWHDGNLETYYNADRHFMADEWTVDDEGFYRDSNGRYVIGVDENSGYSYGDVVETGKGEGVVYDYGYGINNVHDFATTW